MHTGKKILIKDKIFFTMPFVVVAKNNLSIII
jgi:hypothetical protein